MTHCDSPTCKGRLTPFSELKGAEIPAAEAALSEFPGELGMWFRPAAYHRCTAEGCRRFQRRDNKRIGGYLPEGF